MNKLTKKILNISLAFLFAGFLFLPSFALANGLLNIVFEQKPLFQETNFLPGQSITRWIEVENKSPEAQAIAVEVINYSSCTSNCFSEQLELVISKNSINIYTDSLDDFFKVGEIKLSDLAPGVKTKYFFAVTFLTESGNQYQEKTVNFDFKIGSLGKESIGEEMPPGGGSSSGGFFITGLEIFNETVADTELTQTTIAWETNKPATSRVIYSSEHELHALLLDSPPDYGYAHSTAEDSSLKTSHSMMISGLQPATTYYFRCVSRGSLAVSKELKFTTAGVAGEAIELVSETVDSDLSPLPLPKGEVLGEEIELPEEAEKTAEEEILEEIILTEEAAETVSGIGALCWLLLILIIILAALSVFYLIKRQVTKKLILPILVLVATILYYLFCCSSCWALILVATVLFILFLILGRKRKENTQNQPL